MKICPKCKTSESETYNDMFSGTESYIRDHGSWIECKKCGYSGKPLVHTLHIRDLGHEAYETLWNLRKFHGAKSWAELIEKIVKQYASDIKEYDWV